MEYDIVLLTETKLDEMDCIEIHGFNVFTKNKKLKKENLVVLRCYWINKLIEIIDSDMKETLWFRFKEHNSKEDIVFIVIYNPLDTLIPTFFNISRIMLFTYLRTRRQSFVWLEILMLERKI